MRPWNAAFASVWLCVWAVGRAQAAEPYLGAPAIGRAPLAQGGDARLGWVAQAANPLIGSGVVEGVGVWWYEVAPTVGIRLLNRSATEVTTIVSFEVFDADNVAPADVGPRPGSVIAKGATRSEDVWPADARRAVSFRFVVRYQLGKEVVALEGGVALAGVLPDGLGRERVVPEVFSPTRLAVAGADDYYRRQASERGERQAGESQRARERAAESRRRDDERAGERARQLEIAENEKAKRIADDEEMKRQMAVIRGYGEAAERQRELDLQRQQAEREAAQRKVQEERAEREAAQRQAAAEREAQRQKAVTPAPAPRPKPEPIVVDVAGTQRPPEPSPTKPPAERKPAREAPKEAALGPVPDEDSCWDGLDPSGGSCMVLESAEPRRGGLEKGIVVGWRNTCDKRVVAVACVELRDQPRYGDKWSCGEDGARAGGKKHWDTYSPASGRYYIEFIGTVRPDEDWVCLGRAKDQGRLVRVEGQL